MNREDIIRMAREAQMPFYWRTGEITYLDKLERFAALVASAEREKHKWDIHSCSPTCNRYACVATREAVLAEREACIQIVENEAFQYASPVWAFEIVNDIKARGQA